MKSLKKLTSLLLVAVMLLAMSMTAFAAEAELADHTYKAYQIFTGTQEEGKDTLAAVNWGTGVNGGALLTALNGVEIYKDCKNAADVAAVLAEYDDDSDVAKAFAKLAYANKTGTGADIGDSLAAGYYLVVDETEFEEGAENTVYNLALLQLTQDGEFEIRNKTNVPESDKKVDDENDSVVGEDGEDGEVWNDSADYDIGDKVPFKLTATIAENFDHYESYYFTFHDEEEKGLTFVENSVEVSIGGTILVKSTDYTLVTKCEDNCTFEVKIANLKALAKKYPDLKIGAGTLVTVKYQSELNEEANIGEKGNVNKSRLEYSNNPNAEQGGESTGFTPWDNVIVFTYKVDVNKVDEKNTALPGAAFALYKWIADANDEKDGGAWDLVKEFKVGTDTTFSFEGLDDGQYKLVETEAPAGYNKIEDVTFTVDASHKIEWTTEAREEILVNLNGDAHSGEIKFTASKSDGSLVTDVVNLSGTTLPETGGMGTTMFYVIGAILVVGAAVVMITRKRMSR